MNNRGRKIRRKGRTVDNRLPILIAACFAVVAVIALIIMFISFAKKETDSDKNIFSVNANSSENATDNSTDSNESTETPPSVETIKIKKDAPKRIPETAQAPVEYFKDAVFIGDSVSIGLKTGRYFGAENVIANQSVGVDQIARDKPVYTNARNEKITLMQALDSLSFKPKKIYILLGLNGLPGYTNEKQMGYYEDVINKLKAKYPNAIIYCESLTPRAATVKSIYSEISVEKINDFNKKLEALVGKIKNVYYLNVIEALVDSKGYTKAEYAETDGIHLKIAGHKAWYNYLTKHVVQVDGDKKYIEIIKSNGGE